MDFFQTAMAHFNNKQKEEELALQATGNVVPSNEKSFRPIFNPSTQQEDIEYNKALFWEKLTDLGVYLDEFKPVIVGLGNKIVNSTAGAGKTTCINLSICYDIITGNHLKVTQVANPDGTIGYVYMPKRYLVVTFLKTGAEDIKIRFLEWASKLGINVPNLGSMRFSTIHSEVYALIKTLGMNPRILTNEKVYDMVKSLMKQYGIKSSTSYSNNPTDEEVKDIISLIGYARNTLDSKRYTHQIMSEYTIQTSILDALLKQFKLMKEGIGEMDFDDLQEMLLEALQVNPNVVNVVMNRYDRVIVDEFQDVSQLQYGLLRYYFAGYKEIMVVGDDDQTIYSFRGSDISIILEKFVADLNPSIYTLNTNFRCGENILNAVIPSITSNKKRYPKEIKAFNKGGIVQVKYLRDMQGILAEIKKDVINGSAAIIARVNHDLISSAILLELEGGIPFKLSKGVTLRRGMASRILSLTELVLNRYTKNFQSHLNQFLSRKEAKEASMLARLLEMNHNLDIYSIDDESLSQSVPTLYNNVLQYLRIYKQNKDDKGAYLFLLDYLYNVIYTKDNPYHVKAKDFIYFVKELLESHEMVKNMKLDEFHMLMNSTLPAKLDQRVLYEGRTAITLTTVHEAKGKEWDSVYIWNDIIGTFPVQMNREITEDEFEEERRVHFIAMTRAKYKLTIVTQQGKESIYLKECKIQTAEGEQPVVRTVDEKVVFTKEMENPLLYKPIEDLVAMYRDHVNSLNLEEDDARAENLNFQTMCTRNTYEGVIEEIRNNHQYSSRLAVEDEVELQKAFRSIFEDMVNGIRFRTE